MEVKIISGNGIPVALANISEKKSANNAYASYAYDAPSGAYASDAPGGAYASDATGDAPSGAYVSDAPSGAYVSDAPSGAYVSDAPGDATAYLSEALDEAPLTGCDVNTEYKEVFVVVDTDRKDDTKLKKILAQKTQHEKDIDDMIESVERRFNEYMDRYSRLSQTILIKHLHPDKALDQAQNPIRTILKNAAAIPGFAQDMDLHGNAKTTEELMQLRKHQQYIKSAQQHMNLNSTRLKAHFGHEKIDNIPAAAATAEASSTKETPFNVLWMKAIDEVVRIANDNAQKKEDIINALKSLNVTITEPLDLHSMLEMLAPDVLCSQVITILELAKDQPEDVQLLFREYCAATQSSANAALGDQDIVDIANQISASAGLPKMTLNQTGGEKAFPEEKKEPQQQQQPGTNAPSAAAAAAPAAAPVAAAEEDIPAEAKAEFDKLGKIVTEEAAAATVD